jgi:hypothetical protein
VQKQVEDGVGSLLDRGQVVVEAAVETLTPRIEAARETLTPRIETALDVAGHKLSDAGEWAGPHLDTAREQATITVREKVAPAVSKAISQAAEASAPARKEALTRAEAAIAALKGEVGPPRRRRRGRRLAFLVGTGALTGAVVALVVRRKEPAYNAFEPTNLAPGGVDPYARPVASEPPTPPITTMTDEIANERTAVQAEPATTEPPTTIDVTETTVDVDGAADGATATNSGRHRKRTRGGQPE